MVVIKTFFPSLSPHEGSLKLIVVECLDAIKIYHCFLQDYQNVSSGFTQTESVCSIQLCENS